MSTPKFRPSLTEQEIQYIIHLCTQDANPSTADMAHAVSGKLKIFCAKMQLGIVSPAYTAASAQRTNILESLGAGTPQERRLAAYSKWCANPVLCTPEEVAMAQTYRYENNLMTPDEESVYENQSNAT